MASHEMDERYSRRMARRKAHVDARIASASQTRGVLLVITGNGKGKSTAAFGMAARALGHGMAVDVFQFIKNRSDTGEEAFFRAQAGMRWHVCGAGFTWDTQNRAQDINAARAGWELARQALAQPNVGLVVLDEITYLFRYGYLELAETLVALRARPPRQHVVITGRGAPRELLDVADTVSEIANTKHAFDLGIAAQPGVDW